MNCINCDKELTGRSKKYCNNQCQKDYEYKTYITNWLNGIESGNQDNAKTGQISRHIRRFLLEESNNACTSCGWDKLHPVDRLPLVEINHIDGNCWNSSPSNLEVLCPNCHSMTTTFRARNKQSGRIR